MASGFAALVPWLITTGPILPGQTLTITCPLSVFAWFWHRHRHRARPGAFGGLARHLSSTANSGTALSRYLTARSYRPWTAWVAAERLVPKLLGDTLTTGSPSVWMRQAAGADRNSGPDLLLSNETIRAAWTQRQRWVPAWK